ncbi:NADPH-dependent FMN reductase [Chryseolinea soli]|uniref:NADPH-dependent oxidoreductase n=1 Tax=Chryseolinea soli TaxID=2321403 RepID=A0A385SVA4_9BACT|nr:NAD(P)H-dependent oxidoreductase [Chryseolinea soli]AYB34864.1 NADPH-dependent oxidoreductase [Chryseolinea soli]
MTKIAIILGSTRPNRNGEAVAKWVYQLAAKRTDAEFQLIDLRSVNLPLLDEPMPASFGQYANAHTKKWAETIAPFDAFIFVTPEYNHSTCASLKNAIDFLYKEWNNKAAGFVGYGASGATRAVEHLRLIMAELHVAGVRTQVSLSLITDFENFHIFKPADYHQANLNQMLDQVIAWARALKPLRVA